MKKLAAICLALALLMACWTAMGEGSDVTVPNIGGMKSYDVPNTPAMAFVSAMGVGWNLGNTFDAIQDGVVADEMAIEKAWVGAYVTEELIDAVHAAGFDTLRLPVSWHNHVSGEDYTISAPWLERVRQVADWALERDMVVILNTHHDVYPEYYYPSEEHFAVAERYITAIWRQLAERFADCGDKLIFESMNEPRLKDTQWEWWFDARSEECRRSADCINRLNQAFVDTVRASGGNNATRYLMVPAYAASPDSAVSDYFTLPVDSAADRLIVSVHAYTPYAFALQDGGDTRFSLTSSRQTGDIDRFMTALYKKFVAKGVPVVIGEFGARDKQGNLQDRVDYAAYYTAAARAHGMACCWWDNGAFAGEGELFGLVRRTKPQWVYPAIARALTGVDVGK